MASLEDRITPGDDKKTEDWADDNQQLDGSTAVQGGSESMIEPEYDVEVKLIDESSPLYSVKSFQELGLCVHS